MMACGRSAPILLVQCKVRWAGKSAGLRSSLGFVIDALHDLGQVTAIIHSHSLPSAEKGAWDK